MKKIVLTFGLIAGAILSAMMVISMPFHDAIGWDRAEVLGYTTMVVAFMLIFFGVRSYRDNVVRGPLRFGQAFKVGALIAVVASACYVATWQYLRFNVVTDYVEKYQAHLLEEERANGATEEAIAKKKAELDKFAELYKNPFFNVAVTFLEPLPVALVMTLLTAGVLSRRKKGGAVESNVASTSASWS